VVGAQALASAVHLCCRRDYGVSQLVIGGVRLQQTRTGGLQSRSLVVTLVMEGFGLVGRGRRSEQTCYRRRATPANSDGRAAVTIFGSGDGGGGDALAEGHGPCGHGCVHGRVVQVDARGHGLCHGSELVGGCTWNAHEGFSL
jgi:hypothetical protein